MANSESDLHNLHYRVPYASARRATVLSKVPNHPAEQRDDLYRRRSSSRATWAEVMNKLQADLVAQLLASFPAVLDEFVAAECQGWGITLETVLAGRRAGPGDHRDGAGGAPTQRPRR